MADTVKKVSTNGDHLILKSCNDCNRTILRKNISNYTFYVTLVDKFYAKFHFCLNFNLVNTF